jgi:hypothetical protein
MLSSRKQPTSSPRFPRGLELWLWTGVVLLLIVGMVRWRTNSDAAKTSVPVVVQQAPPAEGADVSRPALRAKSSRQLFLEKALAAIQAEKDSEKREEMLSAFMDQIPVADMQVTLEELSGLGLADSECSQRLLRRWVKNDGRAAAAWVAELPAGPMRDAAMTGVAVEWANSSLAAAATWAKTLDDEAERTTAMLTIANEAVRAEPVEAVRLAVALPESPQRDELIHRAATEWAAQDPSGAVAWAGQIPDAALRAKVLAGEAVSWAEQKPEVAASLVVEKLPAGRLLEDTVISIIQRWAQQQPEAAAAWVEQFPEGPLRAAAIENLLVQCSTLAPSNLTDTLVK